MGLFSLHQCAFIHSCKGAVIAVVAVLSVACAKAPPPPAVAANPVALTGQTEVIKEVDDYKFIQYGVAVHIDAPPEAVWDVLTDAAGYASWNSTIVSLQGDIALGSTVELVAEIDPKRTFKLEVSTFEPAKRLVWQDGNDAFRGVRTFVLEPADGGTNFEMKEALSGSFMKMIAPKLPDFGPAFEVFAADLKLAVEGESPKER